MALQDMGKEGFEEFMQKIIKLKLRIIITALLMAALPKLLIMKIL